MPTIEKSP